MMAYRFAKKGFVVFTINYRLAPKNPFPDGLIDTANAFSWVLKYAHQFNADINNIVISGESAGANLITSLALLRSLKFDYPWAEEIYSSNPKIKAMIPACGILQVSDAARFRKNNSAIVANQVKFIADTYLAKALESKVDAALADPLLIIENAAKLKRPLPPAFVFAGSRDPIVEDSARLHKALENLGVHSRYEEYPNMGHAFHAVKLFKQTKRCWKHQFEFLDSVLNA